MSSDYHKKLHSSGIILLIHSSWKVTTLFTWNRGEGWVHTVREVEIIDMLISFFLMIIISTSLTVPVDSTFVSVSCRGLVTFQELWKGWTVILKYIKNSFTDSSIYFKNTAKQVHLLIGYMYYTVMYYMQRWRWSDMVVASHCTVCYKICSFVCSFIQLHVCW